MSNITPCNGNGIEWECKHCTPEEMRRNAKGLLDRLLSQGQAGLVYASTLARGKCREFNDALNIERYRRGWVNRFWFDTVGCPKFIYEALKDEQGLPEKTAAALRRYEELNHVTKELPMPKSELGVFVEHDKVWTTSRDVAAKFEKNHRDVIRSVKNLDCSREFTERNFALSDYKDPTGRTLPQYLMTRDGFTFLAMGFTGAKAARFKEAYIAEFNRMEEELYRRRFALPNSVPKERERELLTVVQKESKKAVTAMTTASRARKRELALQRRLDAALDLIAELKEKEKG